MNFKRKMVMTGLLVSLIVLVAIACAPGFAISPTPVGQVPVSGSAPLPSSTPRPPSPSPQVTATWTPAFDGWTFDIFSVNYTLTAMALDDPNQVTEAYVTLISEYLMTDAVDMTRSAMIATGTDWAELTPTVTPPFPAVAVTSTRVPGRVGWQMQSEEIAADLLAQQHALYDLISFQDGPPGADFERDYEAQLGSFILETDTRGYNCSLTLVPRLIAILKNRFNLYVRFTPGSGNWPRRAIAEFMFWDFPDASEMREPIAEPLSWQIGPVLLPQDADRTGLQEAVRVEYVQLDTGQVVGTDTNEVYSDGFLAVWVDAEQRFRLCDVNLSVYYPETLAGSLFWRNLITEDEALALENFNR